MKWISTRLQVMAGVGSLDKIEYSVPWDEVTGASLVLWLILEVPSCPVLGESRGGNTDTESGGSLGSRGMEQGKVEGKGKERMGGVCFPGWDVQTICTNTSARLWRVPGHVRCP